MTLFVSLVGLQPSAVAVALTTWIRISGCPGQILLLSTAGVRRFAERVREWAGRRHGRECEIVDISGALERRGQLAPAQEVVRDRVGRLQSEDRVVFCGDPGPKSFVVAMARELPETVTVLHSDDSYLHICDASRGGVQWKAVPLQDLGLDDLLRLYGLEMEQTRGISPPLPRPVAQALRGHVDAVRARIHCPVVLRGVEVPAIDVAYEARGRLYALFVLPREEHLQRVRDIERVQLALQGLRPRIAVWSHNDAALGHISAAGHLAVRAGSEGGLRRLREWIQAAAPPPGHEVMEELAGGCRLPPSSGGSKDPGGPRLVVCLGSDPSATLVSLATHRPSHAFILYDQDTPVVVERARRLRANLGGLPIGRVEFVPTDLLGRGIPEWLSDAGQASLENARIDITPGSKAQACALARVKGVELWTLQGHAGSAVPLIGSEGAIPLSGPDLLTAARVTGGALASSGRDMGSLSPQRSAFLALLAEFLACFVAERRRAEWHFHRLENRTCSHGSMSIAREGRAVGRVEVTHKGRSCEGEVGRDDGFWLKELVANAILRAGADEVRTGIRWAWPKDVLAHLRRLGYRRPHRSEIDVVGRFGHRVLCISCKTGPNVSLRAARREVEAVALGGFGRMAVSIVVRPMVELAPVEKSPEASVLAVADLVVPSGLRSKLHTIFESRSTLGDG